MASTPDAPSTLPKGIWIGIDLGTSNSACAVWDSTRGSSKWMRLVSSSSSSSTKTKNNVAIAPLEEHSGKVGRLMPSVVRYEYSEPLPEDQDSSSSSSSSSSLTMTMTPLVGAQALPAEPQTTTTHAGPLISSVKRLVGQRLQDLDPDWMATLPYNIVVVPSAEDEDVLHIQVNHKNDNNTSTTTNTTITKTPSDILTEMLRAIRLAAQGYLDRYAVKKHLQVPGGSSSSSNGSMVRHVVVGVPAHFSHGDRQALQEACRHAGFDGKVSTCLESTAAAMAYGLTLQEGGGTPSNNNNKKKKSSFMVVDMGGGTTDITIARQNKDENIMLTHESVESACQVLITHGDSKLGGDDIDQVILEYCLQQQQEKQGKAPKKEKQTQSTTNLSELRRQCRQAKEALCHLETPSNSEVIRVNKECSVTITQSQFESLMGPWLDRARKLLRESLDRFDSREHEEDNATTIISEVILVGGTTRIPIVRRMIQSFFPDTLELCTSLNPMSSVAQGLAIQAAILSKQIPMHQLRSALMLDCIPHAIGVQVATRDGPHFVEILSRNAPLPATGSATFALADKYQPGVTIRAVEQIGENTFEPMAKEDFTFLLHRLKPDDYRNMVGHRSIQVGMKVDHEGRFMVSIFDELDPEQVRKRERFQQRDLEEVGELGYIADLVLSESETSMEQFLLLGTLIGVVVLYIGVKLAFNEAEEGSAAIL